MRPPSWSSTDSEEKLLTKWHFCVDLTQRMWLPPWLPPAAVGAKPQAGSGAHMLDPDPSISSLGSLRKSLKCAFEPTRWFRSSEQWATCWWRYCVAAVPCGHLTWSFAFQHFNLMMKEFVKAQTNGSTAQEKELKMHHVMLYDQMIRQHWQVQLENEEQFDWDKEAAAVNKEVWAYAEQRLPQTLQAAGLSLANGQHGGGRQVLQGVATAGSDADGAARRAEAAESKVMAASKLFDDKRKALLAQSGGRGNDGDLSNTQRKKLEWTARREADRGGHGG